MSSAQLTGYWVKRMQLINNALFGELCVNYAPRLTDRFPWARAGSRPRGLSSIMKFFIAAELKFMSASVVMLIPPNWRELLLIWLTSWKKYYIYRTVFRQITTWLYIYNRRLFKSSIQVLRMMELSIWSAQMRSLEWAKPVTMELLVIRMSRPFAAKPAATKVMMYTILLNIKGNSITWTTKRYFLNICSQL